MPALEMAQEAGTLVRWLKAEGSWVHKGEPLMEVETDKALVEIEAQETGILANLSAQAGQTIEVGRVIGVLLTEQEYLEAKNPRVASTSVSSYTVTDSSSLKGEASNLTEKPAPMDPGEREPFTPRL